jgi:methionine synthase II (cobalamin-independent)
LNRALRDLAAAGCLLIEVHEPAATTIGPDEAERALFREAQLRLLDGVDGSHRSLAVTGGSADAAGIETILAAPYESLALDLIAGPDNWRLVVATPGDRGIVCGALSAAAGSADGPELLLWAAGYAASTGGRGHERVGLATASSLADLPWEVAVRKLERLRDAVRLADRPLDERLGALDPRAVSSRSAALGRVEVRRPAKPDGPSDPT